MEGTQRGRGRAQVLPGRRRSDGIAAESGYCRFEGPLSGSTTTTITMFSWCSEEQALRHIQRCTDDARALLGADWSHRVEPSVEDWKEHTCRYCR